MADIRYYDVILKPIVTEKSMNSVKGYIKCLSWFSILNFIVLVAFVLYNLGIFNFI